MDRDVQLYGSRQHRIDAKGRVALPAQFRGAFGQSGHYFVIPVPDGNANSLAIYNQDSFDQLVQRLEDGRRAGRVTQSQFTSFMASILQSNLDSQGRINLPTHMLEWASLKRDVSLVGSGTYISILPADQLSPESALQDLPAVSEFM